MIYRGYKTDMPDRIRQLNDDETPHVKPSEELELKVEEENKAAAVSGSSDEDDSCQVSAPSIQEGSPARRIAQAVPQRPRSGPLYPRQLERIRNGSPDLELPHPVSLMLGNDENVIWVGRPRDGEARGISLTTAKLLAFLCLFCIFALPGPLTLITWCVIIAGGGWYHLQASVTLQRTTYAVTNKRILFITGTEGSARFDEVKLDTVCKTSVPRRGDRVCVAAGAMPWDTRTMYGLIDPIRVAEIINKAKQANVNQ